jgi:hypothetical protein
MDRGQVIEGDRQMVVVRAECGFEDVERAPVECLCLLELALAVEERGERGEIRGHFDVVRAERRFANLHRLSCVRLATSPGATRTPRRSISGRSSEAIERLDVDGVGVPVGSGGLGDLDRASEEPLGVSEVATLLVNRGQRVADVGRIGARWTAHALDEAERVAAQDEGPAQPPALQLFQRLVVQRVRRADQGPLSCGFGRPYVVHIAWRFAGVVRTAVGFSFPASLPTFSVVLTRTPERAIGFSFLTTFPPFSCVWTVSPDAAV